jgi:hypothetical protein
MDRKAQLERVAKDWSETIRASQIIPVYPLTEDLEPGDIFLVQLTVDEQHKAYEGSGFLPFENHIDRIYPSGYKRFYQWSFAVGDEETPLPKTWLTGNEAWSNSPNAAFPTYTFSTSSGGALNLALPISGIPVGLSLLGAKSAAGTVTIGDARTYGVDTYTLYRDVRAWADSGPIRLFLAQYGPPDLSTDEPTNYLRVISRVYLTGRVNVSVQASKTFSGGASAGAPTPAELLTARTGKTPEEVATASTENYTEAINKLNEMIDTERGTNIGGTLKVVAASARSISLEETFERPLVIGYIGFDMRILHEGELGPPIPTHAVLERGVSPQSVGQVFFTADEAAYKRALRKAKKLDGTGGGAVLYREVLLELGITTDDDTQLNFSEFNRKIREWRTMPVDESTRNTRMHNVARIINEQLPAARVINE